MFENSGGSGAADPSSSSQQQLSPVPESLSILSDDYQADTSGGVLQSGVLLYFMHDDILAPGTSVLITNTLGSCAEPCGRVFNVTTNLLDATWEYNVSMADVLANNPGLTPGEITPGLQLALPCYPTDLDVPVRYGSDAAIGMFAGGHQRGISGVKGAQLAGAVVGPPAGLKDSGMFYEGSLLPRVQGGDTRLALPVYWFVKLDAEFTVSGITITAGDAMNGISLYVGTNASNYEGNAHPVTNLSFAAGETKIVPIDHYLGKLVVVNADEGSQGTLSLANVQVWPAEGNAALNKPMSSAGLLPLKANYSTDGSLSSCVIFKAVEGEASVWLGVDLGYEADVSVVMLWLGKPTTSAGNDADVDDTFDNLLVYVSSDDTGSALSNATACDAPQSTANAGQSQWHRAVVGCEKKGRYVGIQIFGQQSVNVCEMEVYLAAPPLMAAATMHSKSVVGVAVGSALTGAAIAFAVVGAVVYFRRRRKRQRQVAANGGGGGNSSTHGMIKGSMRNGSSSSSMMMTSSSHHHLHGSSGKVSDPDALETGTSSQSMRHDSITSGAGAPPGGFFRKWIGRKESSELDSGRNSPLAGSIVVNNNTNNTAITTTAGSNKLQDVPSTDLSKFSDGCDVVDFRDIELVRTIGEGSFGLVWMARYLQTTVAVKVLTHDLRREASLDAVSPSSSFTSSDHGRPPQQPSREVMLALQREASIMSSLRHPNCVQILGVVLNPPALIMEYCSKRSVDTILAAATLDPRLAKQLDWMHLLSMACDAAKGMLYLHTRSPPIVHRDLKSPNLLVDGLWHVKVSDFNLSRAMERNSVVSSLQITNPRWLAPEVLKGKQAGVAADVYSFGVFLWELMTWELPWGHDTNPFSIINLVGEGATLQIPPQEKLMAGPLSCYTAYVELMQECWHSSPDARPSMSEIALRLRAMLTEMVQGMRN